MTSLWQLVVNMVFVNSSVAKESTCNAGDPGSIPGSGRSAGEGIGYPFQYSWASLVAQLVKNPPAKWKTWVRSLGWEDPLEKGKATPSSILAWRIPRTVQSMGSQRVGRNWATFAALWSYRFLPFSTLCFGSMSVSSGHTQKVRGATLYLLEGGFPWII